MGTPQDSTRSATRSGDRRRTAGDMLSPSPLRAVPTLPRPASVVNTHSAGPNVCSSGSPLRQPLAGHAVVVAVQAVAVDGRAAGGDVERLRLGVRGEIGAVAVG